MPSIDTKLRVFLYHALQDKPVMRELYQKLLVEGWIDPRRTKRNFSRVRIAEIKKAVSHNVTR